MDRCILLVALLGLSCVVFLDGFHGLKASPQAMGDVNIHLEGQLLIAVWKIHGPATQETSEAGGFPVRFWRNGVFSYGEMSPKGGLYGDFMVQAEEGTFYFTEADKSCLYKTQFADNYGTYTGGF